jgi:hypothetical protein
MTDAEFLFLALGIPALIAGGMGLMVLLLRCFAGGALR